jgi:Fe2+ or Zn2+ uptake regulation protein
MEFREAIQQIREAGHKLTPQRMEILRVLIQARTSITAQAVLERVREVYPYISLDTVYRNLTLMTNAGLISQVNLQSKGTVLFEFQGEAHHHHVICLHCGRNFCVECCPLPTPLPVPPDDPSFRIVSHAFELYGYCSACQKQNTTD